MRQGVTNLVKGLCENFIQQPNQAQADSSVLTEKGRKLLSVNEPDLRGFEDSGGVSIRAGREGCGKSENFSRPDDS